MRWSISSQHCHYYFSRIIYWDDVLEFLTHSEWFLLWVTEHLCVFFLSLMTDCTAVCWLLLCLILHLYLMVFFRTLLTMHWPDKDNSQSFYPCKYRQFCCCNSAADSYLYYYIILLYFYIMKKWLSADIAAEILLYGHKNFYLLCKV